MPSKPNRQLSRLDLSTYNTEVLNAIEAVANSAPYLGDSVLRNDLILDTELRSSNILTHFFIGGGVAELELGVNLLRDGRAWERVSNEVFFHAIRMAWNNYHSVVAPNAMGSSSAEPTVRNADVVWLENWTPRSCLNQGDVMELAFSIAEVWDIRARAQKLNQLLKWKEEGAVVERWVENCAARKEPSRQALGIHIKEMWHAELERQNSITLNKPHLSNRWQPPLKPDTSRFHCDDGPHRVWQLLVFTPVYPWPLFFLLLFTPFYPTFRTAIIYIWRIATMIFSSCFHFLYQEDFLR
jgi:hypothetical protein